MTCIYCYCKYSVEKISENYKQIHYFCHNCRIKFKILKPNQITYHQPKELEEHINFITWLKFNKEDLIDLQIDLYTFK